MRLPFHSIPRLIPLPLSSLSLARFMNPAMKLNIEDRKGKSLMSATLEEGATTDTLKQTFAKQFPRWNVHRQYFTKGVGSSRVVLKPGESLVQQGIQDGDTLVFKDLGPQISWKTVFHVEYFGPILMHALCYYLPELVYGTKVQHSYTQTVAFWCVIFHYLKREYETHFIHRFSNATMPAFNIFKNSAHYWLLGGLFISYFLYHPAYTQTFQPTTVNILAAIFMLCEFGNFYSHYQLRNLRRPGTRERKNPRGFMFELTSCANYTFEVFAWLTFSIMVQTLTSWLFLVVSTAQIALWSIKKHKLLIKEFGPVKGRKILLPFIW